MSVVVPEPQFRALTEAEVDAALADPDPANPVAQEVARLVTAYMANFAAHVERLGYFPVDILRAKPETAIETAAMRLTTETIRDAVAAAQPAEE